MGNGNPLSLTLSHTLATLRVGFGAFCGWEGSSTQICYTFIMSRHVAPEFLGILTLNYYCCSPPYTLLTVLSLNYAYGYDKEKA